MFLREREKNEEKIFLLINNNTIIVLIYIYSISQIFHVSLPIPLDSNSEN